jgi:hypothetical protein
MKKISGNELHSSRNILRAIFLSLFGDSSSNTLSVERIRVFSYSFETSKREREREREREAEEKERTRRCRGREASLLPPSFGLVP